MQGRRRVAWEPGSRNATALPCPPVFRPSARVRWSNCRSWCPPPPGPWLLARRLGEARRPVAALAWCWISGRTARRRSGRCASRRVEVFDSEPDLRSAPLGTARCVREGELLGARGVRLGAEETSRSLGARVRGLPLGGIQQGGACRGRVGVRLGAGETGRFVRWRRCWRWIWSRTARRRSGRCASRQVEVFDLGAGPAACSARHRSVRS